MLLISILSGNLLMCFACIIVCLFCRIYTSMLVVWLYRISSGWRTWTMSVMVDWPSNMSGTQTTTCWVRPDVAWIRVRVSYVMSCYIIILRHWFLMTSFYIVHQSQGKSYHATLSKLTYGAKNSKIFYVFKSGLCLLSLFLLTYFMNATTVFYIIF